MVNLYLPHKAEITDISRETPDVRTYRLRVLSSGKLSRFAAGRFVMIGWPGVGEAPVSLSAFNGGDEFSLTIRAVGRVTDYLARMQPGDEVFCRGPYGRGWPLEEVKGGDLLLVAGGLGLAPLRPVIDTVTTKTGSFNKIRLAYGGREPGSLLYTGEYERWRGSISVSLTVDEVPAGTGWEHDVGLVTGIINRLELAPANTHAFVCGPELMMRFVCRQLLQLGLAAGRIFVSLERRMRCGIGQCGHCQLGPAFVCKDGPVLRYEEAKAFPDTLL
jgi:NAD(P)H-flavin reductase